MSRTAKAINNYTITRHKSGIYSLTFDLAEKSIECVPLNATLYNFYDGKPGTENLIVTLIIPIRLQGKDQAECIRTENRAGNRLTFYFIPEKLLREPKIIEEMERQSEPGNNDDET